MPRFFIEPPRGEEIILRGEDASHISRSLRLEKGDTVTLCDGQGTDYLAVIRDISRETVTLGITEHVPSSCEPRAKVTLYQAMPKSDKMEWIIQKSVELGVDRIVPVLTERCISRPDEKGMKKKLERYQKIALSAAKQSGRGKVPVIEDLLLLQDAVCQCPKDSFVCYEKGGERLCELITREAEEIGLFIGSEGGFSQKEIQLLTDRKVRLATLGPRILRCETAPVAALAVVFSLTGDL